MSVSQRLRRAETRPFQEPGWDPNEAEFSLQRNRLRQNARVLKKPVPLTWDSPRTLRLFDAIDDLDRSDDCPVDSSSGLSLSLRASSGSTLSDA